VRETTSTTDRAVTAVAASRGTIQLSDHSAQIDFETGGFGHGARQVERAVMEQMQRNPLATRHFLSLPLARFAARLADSCPGDLEVSYFCNSGSEAVEGALKLARGFQRNRTRFVAVRGSYHGSSLGALSACGIESIRSRFACLPLSVEFSAAPDQLEGFIDSSTAAVIVEPWPGGSGSRATDGWLKRLADRCAANGTLLIADETRSGVGRTGTMFAAEHERVVPDILVIGGALGGGVLPVAAYVSSRDVNDHVYGQRDPTLHASATGGNPAACVAGLATLQMIEDKHLLKRATATGGLLFEGVRRLADRYPKVISAIHGAGLFAELLFHTEKSTQEVTEAAFEHGLAVRRASDGSHWNVIELYPPILVDDSEIHAALRILEESIATASTKRAGVT
jgi:putrescine aminotransferase